MGVALQRRECGLIEIGRKLRGTSTPVTHPRAAACSGCSWSCTSWPPSAQPLLDRIPNLVLGGQVFKISGTRDDPAWPPHRPHPRRPGHTAAITDEAYSIDLAHAKIAKSDEPKIMHEGEAQVREIRATTRS